MDLTGRLTQRVYQAGRPALIHLNEGDRTSS
jgi:hypothetical protein